MNGTSIQYDEAYFAVTHLHDKPEITPDGHVMYVPKLFTWQAKHQGQGEFKQHSTTGRGYLEFIDHR